MSQKPFTSLIVNQRSSDVLGKQPDVVYILAPASRGGEKRDDDGNVVYNEDGFPVFTASEPFYSLPAFEAEFGLASRGSPASVYAKWLYDYGSFAVRCFRVASDDLAFASGILLDRLSKPLLLVQSSTQDSDGNQIRVDVDKSSGVELYLGSRNVVYDNLAQQMIIPTVYDRSDLLTFEGNIGNQQFFVDFFCDGLAYEYGMIGDKLQATLSLSAWTSIVSVSEGSRQVPFLGTNVELVEGACIYDSSLKRLIFADDISNKWLEISARLVSGHSIIYRVKSDVNFVDMNFADFNFIAAYLNGSGKVNDVTFNKGIRLYNNAVTSIPSVEFKDVNGKKMLFVSDEEFSESYELTSIEEFVATVNLSSRLIAAESVTNDSDMAFDFFASRLMQPIGFKITAYNGSYVDVYDNLFSAGDAVEKITTGLIRVKSLGSEYGEAASTVGLQLQGGSSGLTPNLNKYLSGLQAARSLNDVTVIVAPGVSDATMHYMLGDHCQEMFTHGKHVMAFGGVGIGETIENKIKRTATLNNERFVLVGDGLKLQDPVTGIKQVFSGSIAVMAVIGQILALKYYESATDRKVQNAYGLEHYYDDAELNVLHEARMVVFEFDAGVKTVDCITTSTKNAFEDVHMVRVFDVISRNLQVIMRNSAGESNLPPTWSFVMGKMRKMLKGLVDVGALLDFRVLNEVRPEDLVAKRYRVRVGVIPVFPVKYIEGFVDIIPPTFVEV